MRPETVLTHGNGFTIQQIRQVSPTLAVATVEVGPVTVGSIWVTGIDTPAPQVAWPRSGRGFPVATITSPRLREAIEGRLVETVRSWPAGERRV